MFGSKRALGDNGLRNYLRRPPKDSVLWYPGLNPGGDTVWDYSGNNNKGTRSGAVWVKRPSGLCGWEFDGIDDKITFTSISSAARTQMGWYYLDQNASVKGERNAPWDNFYQNSANNLMYLDGTTCYFNKAIPVGSFFHMAVVVTDVTDVRNGAVIYINGDAGTNITIGGATFDFDNVAEISISWLANGAWDGKIFLPTVLSIAATAAQVQANRNQTRRWMGV